MNTITKNISIFQKVIYILSILIILINISYGMNDKHEESKGEIRHMMRPLELEIDLNKEAFKIDEQIKVTCRIINSSDETIYLAPQLFMNLLMYLKYKDGPAVPFGPKILLDEVIRAIDIIKLHPGESYIFERAISKEHYIMPNKVGQYELYAVYKNETDHIEELKLWQGELRSNVKNIVIYN